jgi:CubicO group peptidase (beta-lactamase class C family)
VKREVVQLQSAHKVPGLAVGVVLPGATPGGPPELLEYTFGVSDTSTRAPVDESTQFEIGSETKLFTGALLANAVNGSAPGGALSLDQTIPSLLPATLTLPGKVAPITLGELGTHRAGLPDDPDCPLGTAGHWPDPAYAARSHYTAADLWAALTSPACSQGTDSPGSAWVYSDFGFGVLGQLLADHEQASAPDFFTLVADQLTQPLGMTRTEAEPTSRTPDLAQPYLTTGAPAPLWDNTGAMAGGGGLVSSIEDMTTFIAAQLGHGPAATVATLRATQNEHAPGQGPDMTMGLAWQITHQAGLPYTYLEKNGGTAGSTSDTEIVPSRGIGVTVLSNSANDVNPMTHALLLDIVAAAGDARGPR